MGASAPSETLPEPETRSPGGGAAAAGEAGQVDDFSYRDELAPPLWPSDEGQQLTRRWERAQDAFIDAPRGAAPEIDSLVAVVAARLPEMFAGERARLEEAWERGEDVPAEDLRIALLRYRAFFGGLLGA